MTWDGTAWDPTVTVQWSYDALGLQFVENVDAIAVNHVAGTLIFSTDAQTNLQPRDQLQVLLPGQTTPLTLVENGGHSIGGPVGIQPTDDIDAVCVIDPEVANANRWLGEPLTKKLPLFQMPLSISRYEDGKNVWSVVQITGVPSHAVDVVLEASLNQGGNYYPLGVYSGGPTVQCAFDLAGLPSMPIQFRAHARDSSGGTLSTSWVSRTQF